MQRFRRILVAVRLPEYGRFSEEPLPAPTVAAIEQAIGVAQGNGATLTFLTVIGDSDVQNAEALIQDADAALQNIVAQATQAGATASGVVACGKPWRVIVEESVRGNFDLVMGGTRPDVGLRRILFGSTATKLMRMCPCPVWIVKPTENDADDRVPQWMVATDLEDVGFDALNFAVNGAQVFETRLLVFHAIEHPHDRRMWHVGLSDEEVAAYRETTRNEREQKLYDQLAQTDYRTITHGVNVSLVDGPPAVCIEQAIEENEVDLLIMGTCARGGIPGMLIGNTAERLLTSLNCSVLGIKPSGFRSPIALNDDTRLA